MSASTPNTTPDGPNITSNSRRRNRLWVPLALLLAATIGVLFASTRHEFAFIDQFHGVRDIDSERQIDSVAFSMGDVPHGTLKIRCYSFRAPAKSVLAALRKELLSKGWTIDSADPFLSLHKGQRLATFDEFGLSEIPGATSTFTVSSQPNWARDRWDELMIALGRDP